MAWISPYVDQSLDITTELQEVFTTVKKYGEFAMKAIRAVVLTADIEKLIVQVKCVGFEESEMAWVLEPYIHQDAPMRLVSQLRTLKLAKATRGALQKTYGIQI